MKASSGAGLSTPATTSAAIRPLSIAGHPAVIPKENYSIIGPGVTQSAQQVVNLREPHGFNIGAAAMPDGVVNNLHLHFTAEVFLKLEWNLEDALGGRRQ